MPSVGYQNSLMKASYIRYSTSSGRCSGGSALCCIWPVYSGKAGQFAFLCLNERTCLEAAKYLQSPVLPWCIKDPCDGLLSSVSGPWVLQLDGGWCIHPSMTVPWQWPPSPLWGDGDPVILACGDRYPTSLRLSREAWSEGVGVSIAVVRWLDLPPGPCVPLLILCTGRSLLSFKLKNCYCSLGESPPAQMFGLSPHTT